MSSSVARIAPLEYRHVECSAPAVLTLPIAEVCPHFEPEAQIPGISEQEVEQRVQAARQAAHSEIEERLLREIESVKQDAQQKMSRALRAFEEERQDYFRRVEREIVQLSLAVARKILGREAEMDPSLLAGLVRRALGRMQRASAVRVHVAPAEAERWREWGDEETGGSRWDVVPDSALNAGECVVKTSLGTANFGFDAQLRDVEESFLQLIAQSPAA